METTDTTPATPPADTWDEDNSIWDQPIDTWLPEATAPTHTSAITGAEGK